MTVLNIKKIVAFAPLIVSLTSSTAFAFSGQGSAVEVVNKVKNQAIGKVESYANEAANKFANTFGEGNTEISIRNIKGDKPDWNIVTTQPLTPLEDDNTRLFWQGSIGSYDQSGDRRTTVNLGLGKRWLLDNENAIAGVNLFTDYETSSKHSRASLGGEYKRSNVEIHANKYWALSGSKDVNGTSEDALDGRDVIFKGQAPYLPWVNIVAKSYQWDRANQDDIKGDSYGVEMYLTPDSKLEVGRQDDNYMDKETYGKLTYSFGSQTKHASLQNKAVSEVAWKGGESMKDHMLDKVERSNKIVVESGGIVISRRD
ncbi:MAG: inverse autotransporter beta domain-containing protein [Candidatus Brocadiales bacterium]|nr:inverse autotransporter beta domain-containing protein [Candidatus Brocadiales bacterium]